MVSFWEGGCKTQPMQKAILLGCNVTTVLILNTISWQTSCKHSVINQSIISIKKNMQSAKRAGHGVVHTKQLWLVFYLNPDWLQPHVVKKGWTSYRTERFYFRTSFDETWWNWPRFDAFVPVNAWSKYCQTLQTEFHKFPKVACPSRHRFYTAYLQRNKILLSTRTAISTFCQASLELFHNRTRIPSGGGGGDVRLLQGPLRSASIFLPWLIAPLPPGAQGSTLHNGPGPWQYNMSGMWNILTPWVVFCGHVCGRSLLSIRTSCETGRRTRNSLKTTILKVETSTLQYNVVKRSQTSIYFTVLKHCITEN